MRALWENVLKKRADRSLVGFLKSMPFFEGFSEKELARISDCFHRRSYKEGELVFKQKDLGVGMYIILRGQVEISTRDNFLASEAEKSIEKQEPLVLKPKDFFGEMALLEPKSLRTAKAKAQTNTKLLGFFQSDLEDLRRRHPLMASKLILRLSEVLAKRLRVLVEKVDEFQIQLEKFKSDK